MTGDAVEILAADRWPGRVRVVATMDGSITVLEVATDVLVDCCRVLFREWQYRFAGLTVEEHGAEWQLRYTFYGVHPAGWVHVVVRAPIGTRVFPSVVSAVHAADWHEREAEDLFGLVFEGHPRLGDFVLHDDAWQEGVEPMRHRFAATTPVAERRPNADWRPHRILDTEGAFAMPIGPVYGGITESAHFLLETVGEDVTRALPRLFYKYRGIEKIAEGRPVPDVLLLAERFAAPTALAHGWAFSRAVETICHVEVPARAKALRVFLAELERLRHHVGAIAGICESTALVVAASQFAMLEEELLRVSGTLTGHRYLFGLITPGGLTRDIADDACIGALEQCRHVIRELDRLEEMLRVSSSFLDRLEEVGIIGTDDARAFGLVGPIARASNIACDLRLAQPYGGYRPLGVRSPVEVEGDGYARLRILLRESRESLRLMEAAVALLEHGPVRAVVRHEGGAAMGWVEAPRGATFHWVRMDAAGAVLRYRIVSPSFINWLGFRLSVERFAFQDFPIILSTLDLSTAESDR